MRASACVRLDLPLDERVALLLEDYAYFVNDPAGFSERLGALTQLRGKAVVQEWQAKVAAGRFEEVVRDLLVQHYDPGYASSIERNFSGYASATTLTPANRSASAMAEAARELLSPVPA
jgi:tRNA 2-selenouridine synthase